MTNDYEFFLDPSRCIGCQACVQACGECETHRGVPKMQTRFDLMMKCDLCYDRTSAGKKPMCATVCPSGALFFGPREYVEKYRREKPVNEFQFGRQTVRTKVNVMTVPENDALSIDIAGFLPLETPGEDRSSSARAGAPDAADAAVWKDISLRCEEETASL